MAYKPKFLIEKKLFRYLSLHPTVGITISYLAISGVGVLHEVNFFKNFGIDIIDYFEPIDFFLASFKRPILFILPFYILLAIFTLSIIFINLHEIILKFFIKFENKNKFLIIAYEFYCFVIQPYVSYIILIVFYLVYFPTTFYANYNANKILTHQPTNVIFLLDKGEEKK